MDKIYKIFNDLQGSLPEFEPDAENPYFSSKYISLASIMSKLRPVMAEMGLGLVQRPTYIQSEHGALPALETIFYLIDGDDDEGIISSTMLLTAKANDPQAQGSALTYARRYALLTMLGIVPAETDDDGQSALDVPVTKRMSEANLIEIGQLLSSKGITSKQDKVAIIDILGGTKPLNTSAVNRLKKAINEATPQTLEEIALKGEVI